MPLALVGFFAASGCIPTPKRGFDSPDGAMRLDAAVHAADARDASSVSSLVRLLDSDDPATRLVAIRSLERITGTTLGYDHAAPASQREQAVVRWQRWVRENQPGAGGAGVRGAADGHGSSALKENSGRADSLTTGPSPDRS